MNRRTSPTDASLPGRTGRCRSLCFLVLLVFLCTGSLPVSIPAVAAPARDAAVAARQLQLEGVQLQLKGHLDEAVEKYRQSLALKPNEKLETLVSRLEKQVEKRKAAARAASAASPAGNPPKADIPAAGEPAAGQVQERQVAGEPEKSEKKARPHVAHHAASAGEQQVYDFVDWTLDSLTALIGEGESWLDTNWDYQVERSGTDYVVRLDPFVFNLDEEKAMDLGPLVVSCRPAAANRLRVRVELPQRIPLLKFGKPSSEVTIGERKLVGTWDPGQRNFQSFDLALGAILVKKLNASGQLAIRRIAASSVLEENGQGRWQQVYSGAVDDIALEDAGFAFVVKEIEASAGIHGFDLASFQEVRSVFSRLAGMGEEIRLEDTRELFHGLDRYIQLLDSSESRFAVRGIQFRVADEGLLKVDHVELGGTMTREGRAGPFDFRNRGAIQGLAFTRQGGEEGESPFSLTIRKVGLDNSLKINPVPGTLFADIYDDLVVKAMAMEDEKAGEEYLARNGVELARRLLDLIGGGTAGVTLSGLQADGVMPQPVRLEQAGLSTGFATGGQGGGSVHLNTGFTGFSGVELGEDIVPRAAAFNLKLAGIPSLFDLLGDPATLVEGKGEQVQNQVMMHSMNALLTSGLSLSLLDSFITFPTSRIAMDMKAGVDGNAAYLATGTLQLAIENPDKVREIVTVLAGDPKVNQMLATLTALADRSSDRGKTVDRIAARLTPEGRIMVNNKDVTEMFIPSAPAQQPAGAAAPEEKREQAPAAAPQG